MLVCVKCGVKANRRLATWKAWKGCPGTAWMGCPGNEQHWWADINPMYEAWLPAQPWVGCWAVSPIYVSWRLPQSER